MDFSANAVPEAS